MTENLVRQSFAPGARIFADGDAGNVVYLIEQGKVELATDQDGRKVVLAELGGGEMIGELSVIDGEPRSATATALEDTQVIIASRVDLLKQIEAADDWVQLMLRVMIDRLRDVQQGVTTIGAAPPDGIGYPEPVGVPEPIGASGPPGAPEPIAAPEPLIASDPIVAPEPVVASEPIEMPDIVSLPDGNVEPVFDIPPRVEVDEEPAERLEGLAGELQIAIEENQLELNFQPIISIAERYVAGFEALIRWQHPKHGTIVPSNFISLAESTGLIVPLGRWLLERALKDLKTFQGNSKRNGATPPLYMSVNVSSRQLLSDIEIQDLCRIVRDSGASPEDVMFEITENLMIEDPDNVAAAMAEFRAMGIRTAADDFGTGYANLEFLKNFPLDMIKIDRAFISHLDTDDRNRRLVETIINLARQFDLKVVAEGIEMKGEMNVLRELGCDFAQGYLVSKPITATNALPIINQQILW